MNASLKKERLKQVTLNQRVRGSSPRAPTAYPDDVGITSSAPYARVNLPQLHGFCAANRLPNAVTQMPQFSRPTRVATIASMNEQLTQAGLTNFVLSLGPNIPIRREDNSRGSWLEVEAIKLTTAPL